VFAWVLGVLPGRAHTQTATTLDVDTLLHLADAAHAANRLDEARKALLYALQQRPDDPTIAGLLGRVEAGRGRFARAAGLLDDAVPGNGGRSAA